MNQNQLLPHWPNDQVDEFVDFVGLVPGDVATIRIQAKSFVRVFIYKAVSESPVVEVSHDDL